ncbi:uncharacterized protein V6R79_021221 [Siganus canaliculatus]
MKVAIIFVLLFATVLCRPARKASVSSSESSEEVVKQPAASQAPLENVATSSSDESSDETTTEATSDTTSSSDTASVSKDSEDDDDDDDEEDETDEDEDESSDSSESGEASTPAPTAFTAIIVTDEPLAETTPEPIEPTIVTDTARGDNFGAYPSDYKSIVYVEEKTYEKLPSPYKSYELVGAPKKMAYDMSYGNEVEKSLQTYKALQVHSDILEEDTSTPEVESQGLDVLPEERQAVLPEGESTSEPTTSESESSSAPEEEESVSTTSESTSQDSEDSQSSEEAGATAGGDSDSDESDSAESESDEGAVPDATTDMPAVITAK